jgi:hypothetical protein
LCGGQPIRSDDFYQLVMSEHYCDEPKPDTVPAGFTCE